MRRLAMALAGLGLVSLVLFAGATFSRADLITPGQTRTVKPQVPIPREASAVIGFRVQSTKRTLTIPGAGAPVVPALIGVAVIIVAMASWSVLARLAAVRRHEAETVPDDPPRPDGG